MQVTSNGTTALSSWTGEEVCIGNGSASLWLGISCAGGRVAQVNLNNLGATGPLDAVGQLTALVSLQLSQNSFAG